MEAPEVKRLVAYVEFSGGEPARELLLLIKTFLEASMYRVEYLSPHVETKTLKVFDVE